MRRLSCISLTVAVLVATTPLLAHADLGGAPVLPVDSTASITDSSETALASVKAATNTAGNGYTVRAVTLANGTTEREYLNADGTVFGVAWAGAFPPDLQTLFGATAFDTYVNALHDAQATRPGRQGGPVAISTSGVVVQMGGHQGAVFGRAYVPDLVPSNVSLSVIQ